MSRDAKAHSAAGRPNLASTQQWLQEVVTCPGDVIEGLARGRARVSVGSTIETELQAVIRPSQRMSAIERVSVYHSAYWARLVECLTDDYPALAHALGEREWRELCEAYIAHCPSRATNLNRFGQHMEALLRGREGTAAYAADLAALEWALVEVVHAPEAGRAVLTELATLPPEAWGGLRLRFAPCVRILEGAYDVNQLYQCFRQTGASEPPSPGFSAVVVYREGLTLWRLRLSRASHAILSALAAGRTLGEALASIDDDAPTQTEVQTHLMSWFRGWCENGFFCGYELPTS